MFDMDKIIIIQKNIRKYLIRKNILIPHSIYQTKDWRKNQKWYNTGKSNECEKYQINLVEKILNKKINKTFIRINIETNDLIENKNPLKFNDGFEWTENFDGYININNNNYYFNLKFVCDKGGMQTRTLREVYHFIINQINYLIKSDYKNNIYFINILDGDNCFYNYSKFIYLINKYDLNIKKYIFVGSLYEFQNYYNYAIKFSRI